jgi:DNA-binding NarL/FixJ family response regulator
VSRARSRGVGGENPQAAHHERVRKRVLELVRQGVEYRAIAERVGLRPNTVSEIVLREARRHEGG